MEIKYFLKNKKLNQNEFYSEGVIMKFAIAIIFFNPDNDAINRAEKYADQFEAMLIVDNTHSHDMSMRYANSRIEYKWMGGNKGISVALEYSFRWAHDHHVQYLLTLDQDTVYLRSEVAKMKEYILTHPGKGDIYCANWRKIYWDRHYQKKKLGPMAIPRDEVREVYCAMTSGSWMDVEKAMEILPLENYFVSYVDRDISLQFKKKGYKILSIGNSVLYQQIGGKVIGSRVNLILKKLVHTKERYYYMSRNNLYLVEKYADDEKVRLMLIKDRIRILFNLIFLEENKIQKYKYWIKGKEAYTNGQMGEIKSESFT